MGIYTLTINKANLNIILDKNIVIQWLGNHLFENFSSKIIVKVIL
jgi:hypothetical protein